MSRRISRRDFARQVFWASAAGLAVTRTGSALAFPNCAPEPMPRTLVNLMLYGGIDSRFVFMPHPLHHDLVYLDKLWAARQLLYPEPYPDYASMFETEYLPVTDAATGLQFGIHGSCGWLASEFSAGRVAVVANSVCSRNRRHDQSQLNANAGDPVFNNLVYNRDGWGGRLVEACGSNARTVELSHEISVFGQGSVEGQRLEQIVHAQNTRDIALPGVDPTRSPTDRRNVVARALESWYVAAETELRSGTPFDVFFGHHRSFRELGATVAARLDACGPLPASLAGLHLASHHFGQQCKNLYDVCLAPEIFRARAISMRYDGWDTHKTQHQRIGQNLSDVFGNNGGLAAVTRELDDVQGGGIPASEQLVLCVTSDFGRQLIANGDNGTDHGRGLYTVTIGHGVRGGVYGEMFPERESNPDHNGKIPLETSGADIRGLTSTQRILSAACDWVQPGSGGTVFPDASVSDIETPGLLDGLFRA